MAFLDFDHLSGLVSAERLGPYLREANIGPEEVARRRRAGPAGLIVSVAVFALLLAVSAPHRTLPGRPALAGPASRAKSWPPATVPYAFVRDRRYAGTGSLAHAGDSCH